jgi:hypothetical protein
MAHLTEHTVHGRDKYYYRFNCEHCGKDSGWFYVNINSTEKVSTVGYNTKLATDDAMNLHNSVNATVNSMMKSIKAEVAKGHYAEIGANGRCLHCNKLQSWVCAGQIPWIWGSALVALFLSFGALFFYIKVYEEISGEVLRKLLFLFPISGTVIGLIFGLIMFFLRVGPCISNKKRNKPEINFDFPKGIENKNIRYGGELGSN